MSFIRYVFWISNIVPTYVMLEVEECFSSLTGVIYKWSFGYMQSCLVGVGGGGCWNGRVLSWQDYDFLHKEIFVGNLRNYVGVFCCCQFYLYYIWKLHIFPSYAGFTNKLTCVGHIYKLKVKLPVIVNSIFFFKDHRLLTSNLSMKWNMNGITMWYYGGWWN